MNPSLIALFQLEIESQVKCLNDALIRLELGEFKERGLYAEMIRFAHSIKGAAKVAAVEPIVQLAHTLEDCFSRSHEDTSGMDSKLADLCFKAFDYLASIANASPKDLHSFISSHPPQFLIEQLQSLNRKEPQKMAIASLEPVLEKALDPIKVEHQALVKVEAAHLNRLMGLAGESMIASKRLKPFETGLLNLKMAQSELSRILEKLKLSLRETSLTDESHDCLASIQKKHEENCQTLSGQMAEFQFFIGRQLSIADRLYTEVLDSRMRPFEDCLAGFARMLRDMAKQLHKRVLLEVAGKKTLVDRDILEKLEAPLSHLLRNSLDHGIEAPAEREANGKNPIGSIRLQAEHRAGFLFLTLSDDGRGVDLNQLKQAIIQKKLINENDIDRLSSQELLEYLFLPGFTMAKEISDISGRGMGLSIIKKTMQELSGSVSMEATEGKGVAFYFQLPLTLSVMRALLVEIGKDSYAIPLARVEKVEILPVKEGMGSFYRASSLLGIEESLELKENLPVVFIGNRVRKIGLIVGRLLGEKELVVQPLSSSFSSFKSLWAGAVLDDGSPVLILDVEEIISASKGFENAPNA